MKATDLNTAVFTFGRMNPPTVGHAKLVDMIKRQPGKPYVFLSHTQKPKTDPLSFQQKLKYAKQSFTGVQIGDPGVTNIIGALQALEKKGYSHVIMVVGSDRVGQFQEFLPKYNGKDFKFDSIKVVSAGERDPDAEGVAGMSASKLKKLAAEGKFEDWKDKNGKTQPGFKRGVVDQSSAKEMYNDVRAGMGITEVLGFATTRPKTYTVKKRPPEKIEPNLNQKVKDRLQQYRKTGSWDKNPETVKEDIQNKPLVYVDMDGVIADFFSALAKFRGVDHWKAPGGKFDVEDSITAIAGTDFFSTLPVFPTANQLISAVKSFTGGTWNICSSPLRNDHENSKKHKIAWLKEHGFDPKDIIITGRKESYAKDKTTGAPNILIDDKPSNIERWQAKNGIGIRYQANQDSVSKISTALKLVQQYIEKHNEWTPELVAKVNQAVNTGTMVEHGGRVVKGINTTVDVGVDAIKKQSAKMGFNVTKDGVPPKLQSGQKTKKLINVLESDELKFQNQDGKLSLTTLPGTKKWQKMKKNSKPGTLDWFKTWKTLPLLTKGRKNHYMPPVKERLEAIQHNLELLEKWSKKYKDAINCSNPKGFSQKAHCSGRKK